MAVADFFGDLKYSYILCMPAARKFTFCAASNNLVRNYQPVLIDVTYGSMDQGLLEITAFV